MEHFKQIYDSNGNRFWPDVIDNKITNVAVSFETYDESKPAPIGWTKAIEHLVFDVNMDFTRKS